MSNEAADSGLSESFILGLIASCAGFVSMLFASMRKSRCENLSFCFGLAKCKRHVLTAEELAIEPPSPLPPHVAVKI